MMPTDDAAAMVAERDAAAQATEAGEAAARRSWRIKTVTWLRVRT
jgi:hypothetical protein